MSEHVHEYRSRYLIAIWNDGRWFAPIAPSARPAIAESTHTVYGRTLGSIANVALSFATYEAALDEARRRYGE